MLGNRCSVAAADVGSAQRACDLGGARSERVPGIGNRDRRGTIGRVGRVEYKPCRRCIASRAADQEVCADEAGEEEEEDQPPVLADDAPAGLIDLHDSPRSECDVVGKTRVSRTPARRRLFPPGPRMIACSKDALVPRRRCHAE